MAGLKESKTAEVSELMPVLAAAALSNGAGGDNALVQELMEDLLQERRERKARKERIAKEAIKATAEAAKQRSIEKSQCSHRNKLGHTRLRGQKLSGTNQLCLLCTWCQQEFFSPPREGQLKPPADLMPLMDVIGG